MAVYYGAVKLHTSRVLKVFWCMMLLGVVTLQFWAWAGVHHGVHGSHVSTTPALSVSMCAVVPLGRVAQTRWRLAGFAAPRAVL